MNPLIEIQIELKQNEYASIKIFKDTNPDELAKQFVKENNLPQVYIMPVKQNIIKQMCLYDSLKNDKENNCQITLSPISTSKSPNKQDDVKKIKSQSSYVNHKKNYIIENKNIPSAETDSESSVYVKLYEQSKLQHQRKINLLDEDRKKRQLKALNESELTFTPRINCKSKAIVANNRKSGKFPIQAAPKTLQTQMSQRVIKISRSNSPLINPNGLVKTGKRIDYKSDQKPDQKPHKQPDYKPKYSSTINLWNPLYTEEQIESSFNEIMKKEFHLTEPSNSIQIQKLFNILDTNDDGLIDPKIIPYERLSSQLYVSLRAVLRNTSQKYLSLSQFKQIVNLNPTLIKIINDFYGIR